MRIRNQKEANKIELQMTAMIDIVFLLLVFFVMTFQIVLPEGDFNVNMPQAGANTLPDEVPLEVPLNVRLRSDDSGNLQEIRLGDRSLASFDLLHAEIRRLQNESVDLSKVEVSLESDEQLKYRYVMDAMTAVTGYRDQQGKTVSLISKVRFAPRK